LFNSFIISIYKMSSLTSNISRFGSSFTPFFLTVATTLGTGILGLPVRLSQSGLGPTIFVLTVVLFMQLAVAALMTELLQRASAISADTAIASSGLSSIHEDVETDETNSPEIERKESDIQDNMEDVTRSENNLAPVSKRVTPKNRAASIVAQSLEQLSMHTLSHLFLTPTYARLFDWCVLLHFGSILTSYVLAGSLAFARLFLLESSSSYFVAPFSILLTIFLIVFSKRIAVIVSALTAAKLALILLVAVAVGAIAAKSRLNQHDDWNYTMHPFLISTVALGGMANLMPVMFRSVPASEESAQKVFLMSVSAGLCVCWALNIGWAASILSIVPQTSAEAISQGFAGGASASLEYALQTGQISTIPLTLVIGSKFPSFSWISTCVSVFIALSISVSYIIMGTGLKSVLEGMASSKQWRFDGDEGLHEGIVAGAVEGPRSRSSSSFVNTPIQENNGNSSQTSTIPQSHALTRMRTAARLVFVANQIIDSFWAAVSKVLGLVTSFISQFGHLALVACARRVPFIRTEVGRRRLLYVFSFGLVIMISQLNPGGFLSSLEIFTSLALNISSGVLVSLMFSAAVLRSDTLSFSPTRIPWPLPSYLRDFLPAFVLVSFSLAVGWDILEVSARLIGWTSALWLGLAFIAWLWHARYLNLVVETLIPSRWRIVGASSNNAFLHLVVWANVSMLEALAVASWSGVECVSKSEFTNFFLPIANRSLVTAVIVNEIASIAAAASAHLDSSRADWPSWVARRVPIFLGYVASLANTGGAVSISACGCGASASFAWWALLVQLASVAAAYIMVEAAEGGIPVVEEGNEQGFQDGNKSEKDLNQSKIEEKSNLLS
jgi:amino acid permease